MNSLFRNSLHIVITSALVMTSYIGQAQSVYQKAAKFSSITSHQRAGYSLDKTQLAVPFFTEDFASGIPATWGNIDNAGSGVVWVYTTTGAYVPNLVVDAQLNPIGTSASNGYAKIDSDSAGFGVLEDASLVTPAINCTGHTNVRLSFNEYFAQFGASTGTVSVSNNGTTWTPIHSSDQGLLQDSSTVNPYAIDVDITSVAANQPAVYIRFKYTGNFDYWWFVDDVALYEPLPVDLEASSVSNLDVDYTQIPLTQATSFTLSGSVKNAGLNTATGGSALFEVIDAATLSPVYADNVSVPSLASGASFAVIPSLPFSAMYAADYKARITATIAGDGDLLNNVKLSLPVTVSDTVYARDDGNVAGILGIGAGVGEDGIAGQNFMVNSAGDIVSVTFYLVDTLSFDPGGTPVYFTIHPQVNDSTAPGAAVAYTDTLILTNGMIPAGGAFYTLPVHGGALSVTPGLYFVGFHEVDYMLPMAYSLNNVRSGAVWVHWNSIPVPPAVNGWARAEDFGFEVCYLIRANFNVGSGINTVANADDLFIYPNPSSGIFNVAFGELAKQNGALLTVTNLLGQVVWQQQDDNSSAIKIDASAWPKGMYNLVVKCDNSIMIKKIVLTGN